VAIVSFIASGAGPYPAHKGRRNLNRIGRSLRVRVDRTAQVRGGKFVVASLVLFFFGMVSSPERAAALYAFGTAPGNDDRAYAR